MAEEKDLKLEQPEGSGGNKKTIIMVVIGAIVLMALAVGATVFIMNSDDDASEQNEDSAAQASSGGAAEGAEGNIQAAPIAAQYVKLKPEFVVNYNVGARQRFLQVSVEIMTHSQGIVDAVELHSPMLRNEIIRVLGEQDFNTLRSAEGKVKLQQQLRDHMAQTLKNESGVEGVEALLFTNFVMQ